MTCKHNWRFGRSKKARFRARECMKCGKTQAYLTEGSTQYVDVDVEVWPVPEWIWANPHWRKDWPEKKWDKLLGEKMPVTPELEQTKMKTYRCPFCDAEMEKKEMQYHVGIPLCMDLRKVKAETIELKIVLPKQNPDIPRLDYEYFGDRGIRNLMTYMFQRLTLGHPDKGKPIDLESFVDHSED